MSRPSSGHVPTVPLPPSRAFLGFRREAAERPQVRCLSATAWTLAIGPAGLHDVLVKLRTPTAVAGAVGAISLTACSFTAPLAAHTTARGRTSAMASSAAPAYPATAGAAGPLPRPRPGDRGRRRGPRHHRRRRRHDAGQYAGSPARPGDVPGPVRAGPRQRRADRVREPRRHADHGHGQKCGPGGAGADCYAFRDPPAYVRHLKDAGFTILNDANNHAMDFGPACQAQTVDDPRRAWPRPACPARSRS